MASSRPITDLVAALRTVAEVSAANTAPGRDLVTPLLVEAADQIEGFVLLAELLDSERQRLTVENYLLRV